MGILNVTPDSFSDGGRFYDLGRALLEAERMTADGAAVIDIGGQSTRPGYEEITAEDEIARVAPVIASLVGRVRIPLSIDTYKPAVARAALQAGAHLLNDVHGLQGDPAMAEVAAEFGCPVVLMHQDHTFRQGKGTTVEKLKMYFDRSIARATEVGIPRDRLILDPGIGFSKTQEQNLEIMGRLGELRAWGFPVLLGASRKSVIGNVLGLPPTERLEGTLATTALAAWHGAELIRVHDVAANLRVAKMIGAIRTLTPHS